VGMGWMSKKGGELEEGGTGDVYELRPRCESLGLGK